MEFSEELITHMKGALGLQGLEAFRKIKEATGEVSPVVSSRRMLEIQGVDDSCTEPELKVLEAIPHPVHFREGTAVRNMIRDSGLVPDWSDHDLDNNWAELVEAVIE